MADMEYRRLGNSGIKVSVLSLGGWVTFGKSQQVEDDSQALEIFQEAWKHGINFFDTAEGYGKGECEETFGRILKKLNWPRSQYVLTTKVFFGGSDFGNGINSQGLSRKHIIEGINNSLKRLQLDYVDVYFAHRPDPQVPMEEIVRAFTQVINDGKAFYWATSEWSAFEIEHAHHVATKFGLIPPIADQVQYSLLHRDRVDSEYLPLFDIYKYGTTVWSPLASGILTGKYLHGIPQDSRLNDETVSKNPALAKLREKINSNEFKPTIHKLEQFVKLASEINVTPAQLALAWIIKNPNVSTIITGATHVAQVVENVKAYQVSKNLTPEVLDKIEKIFDNKPAPVQVWRR